MQELAFGSSYVTQSQPKALLYTVPFPTSIYGLGIHPVIFEGL